MPKQKISRQEHDKIYEQAQAAEEILTSEKFAFLRDYFENARRYVEQSILNNTVREVQEVTPLSDKLTRIFKTPKKVQVDELVGQHKLITKFFDDMRTFVAIRDELEKELTSERITIDD